MAAKQNQSITVNKKQKGKQNEVYFSEDLLHTILLNLDVTSLGRFKCVSKPWNSLISSTRFIRDHSRIHQSNPTMNCYLLCKNYLHYLHERESKRNGTRLLLSPPAVTMMHYGSIFKPLPQQQNRQAIKIGSSSSFKFVFDRQLPSNCDAFQITCCCDGLICISECDRLLLWNPCMGKHKTLPLPDPDATFPAQIWDVFGLGYDSSTDDYKVVRVPSCDDSQVCRNPSVYVMTLKSNLWRKLDIEFPYAVHECGQAISTGGSLYWFALIPRMANKVVLIRFDLETEICRELPMPPNLHVQDANIINEAAKLGILEGCISSSSLNPSKSYFDIWMLKGEIWIKFMSVPTSIHKGEDYIYSLRPLFTDNGGLVMHATLFNNRLVNIFGDLLLIYHPKQDTCRKFHFPGRPDMYPSEVYLNFPSLLSLSI
ncbi:F-box/kelch-repeat protein At3g23880-like [Mercurialis annua]|uniref:F-box/kelch-repeat protein At3g23880-like n=1 Tax=Mercurialis annua TaxID=3986 RepID=UPI002160D934|nr:F-box/kelch-repeat protein At3g23880-like [Mercurialis annua]